MQPTNIPKNTSSWANVAKAGQNNNIRRSDNNRTDGKVIPSQRRQSTLQPSPQSSSANNQQQRVSRTNATPLRLDTSKSSDETVKIKVGNQRYTLTIKTASSSDVLYTEGAFSPTETARFFSSKHPGVEIEPEVTQPVSNDHLVKGDHGNDGALRLTVKMMLDSGKCNDRREDLEALLKQIDQLKVHDTDAIKSVACKVVDEIRSYESRFPPMAKAKDVPLISSQNWKNLAGDIKSFVNHYELSLPNIEKRIDKGALNSGKGNLAAAAAERFNQIFIATRDNGALKTFLANGRPSVFRNLGSSLCRIGWTDPQDPTVFKYFDVQLASISGIDGDQAFQSYLNKYPRGRVLPEANLLAAFYQRNTRLPYMGIGGKQNGSEQKLSYDAEFKILATADNLLQAIAEKYRLQKTDLQGTFYVATDIPSCTSCADAYPAFQDFWPNLEVMPGNAMGKFSKKELKTLQDKGLRGGANFMNMRWDLMMELQKDQNKNTTASSQKPNLSSASATPIGGEDKGKQVEVKQEQTSSWTGIAKKASAPPQSSTTNVAVQKTGKPAQVANPPVVQQGNTPAAPVGKPENTVPDHWDDSPVKKARDLTSTLVTAATQKPEDIVDDWELDVSDEN